MRLLPMVPERYRGVVAVAGRGERWGEAIGLRADAMDLSANRMSVIWTVIKVGGAHLVQAVPQVGGRPAHSPAAALAVPIIREHRRRSPVASDEPIFANEVGAPPRRTLFRARIWRPSLVRAGLLGEVVPVDDGFQARRTDDTGAAHTERHRTHGRAVHHVARHQAGGLRFHDLRTKAGKSRG